MKVFKFPQPDGTFLVLTQDAQDPTRFVSAYADGSTIADRIQDRFAAGHFREKK